MKKRAIKVFSHVFVLSALALFSCSKSGTITHPQPVPPGKDSTIQVKPPAPPVKDSFPQQQNGISAKKIDTKGGNVTDYLLYIPDGYNDRKDYKWPAVIFLHGVGEMGTDINVLRNVGLVKVAAGKTFPDHRPAMQARLVESLRTGIAV